MAKKKTKKKVVSKKKVTKRKAPSRSKRAPKKEKVSKVMAIIGLLINVLIFPGIGTLLSGKARTGIYQIALFVLGWILALTIADGLGVIAFAAWIWGLASGVHALQGN